MSSPPEFRVILSTVGSDAQAEEIARALVDERLAACVNIVGGVCSVYRWKEETVREGETLLVVKTLAAREPAVRRRIRELHTYETPEILALGVTDGDPDYLAWLQRGSSEI